MPQTRVSHVSWRVQSKSARRVVNRRAVDTVEIIAARADSHGNESSRMTTNAKDRRSRPRDTISADPPRDPLVSMIRGTYHEMPGLRLQIAEAARLFGL